jgi:ribosome-associated heat shock protein Hsp15
VRPDDVLTIVIRGNIRVLKVLAPGVRRGRWKRASSTNCCRPGQHAPARPDASGERARGTGRPSKRERRQIDRFTEQE